MEDDRKAKILLEYGSMESFIQQKLFEAYVDAAEIEERLTVFFHDHIGPEQVAESYDAEELSGDPEEATYSTWNDAWEDNRDQISQRLAEEYALMVFDSDKDMEEELLKYIMHIADSITMDGQNG
jgi:hypothetical protein